MGEPTMDTIGNRRPLAMRRMAWAGVLARKVTALGITANAVSAASIAFAVAGAAAMLLAPVHPAGWLAAALFIQLRLLANMLDGLVAIEGGRASPTGPLYNEAPDRIADSVLLIAAGHAAGLPELGWCAALFAMGTAYARALGGTLDQPQDFCGPMAKQHRMALLTAGALLSAALPAGTTMAATLALIAIGSAFTCWRRLTRIARRMKAAAR